MEDEPKNEQPVQTGTQNPTIECPKCKSVESSENTYCTNCGGPLRGSAVPSGPAPSVTPSADNLVNARSREQLKHARIAIMVVAVLMVIMAIFLWYNMDKEIKKVEANPMMVVNQEA
ncbi:MAG: hypothetical protein GY950_32835, partial [bacterium]|nr:hypothetical protein [bacterium]